MLRGLGKMVFLALFIVETGHFDPPTPPNPSTSFGGSKSWCLFMRRFLRKQLADHPLYVSETLKMTFFTEEVRFDSNLNMVFFRFFQFFRPFLKPIFDCF